MKLLDHLINAPKTEFYDSEAVAIENAESIINVLEKEYITPPRDFVEFIKTLKHNIKITQLMKPRIGGAQYPFTLALMDCYPNSPILLHLILQRAYNKAEELEYKFTTYNMTLAHLAASNNYILHLRALLNHGANPNFLSTSEIPINNDNVRAILQQAQKTWRK